MALDYNLVTWKGDSPGSEIWNSSCAFQSNSGTGPVKTYEDLLTWAQAIAGITDVDIRGVANLTSPVAQVKTIRVAYIDSAGLTAQFAEAQAGSGWSAVGDATKPFQVSIVASLLTGRPGRSYRGRMYWPAFSAAISTSTMVMAPTDVATVATSMAKMLTLTGQAAGVDAAMQAAVNSKKLGTTNFVTQIRVGGVLDTQRRRRNAVAEGYKYAAYPAT